MQRAACLLLALLASVSAVTFSDIQGTWSGTNGGCGIFVQFHFKNYLSYNVNTTGTCEESSVTLGTYALAGTGGILIDYIVAADGLPPQVYADIELTGTNSLRISKTTGDVNFDIRLTRRATAAYDGVWSGAASNAPNLYAEFLGGTYLSYSKSSEEINAFMGVFIPSGNTALISYAESTQSEVVGVTIPDATFTSTANSFNLSSTRQLVFNAYFDTRPAATDLEGVWTGYEEDDEDECVFTVQIKRNLFRTYRSHCLDGDSHAYLGVVTIGNSGTTFTVDYGYSTDFDIQGTSRNFLYSVNETHLTITSEAEGESSGFTLNLVNVETAPRAVEVRVVLNMDFEDFDEETFVADLARDLDISPSNIIVLSASAGSTVVDFLITDDQGSGQVSAEDALAALRTLSSIGGAPLESVSDVTPSSAASLSFSALFAFALFLFARLF